MKIKRKKKQKINNVWNTKKKRGSCVQCPMKMEIDFIVQGTRQGMGKIKKPPRKDMG